MFKVNRTWTKKPHKTLRLQLNSFLSKVKTNFRILKNPETEFLVQVQLDLEFSLHEAIDRNTSLR